LIASTPSPAPAAADHRLRATRWRKPALAFATPFLLLVIFEGLAYSPLGSDWLFLVDVAVFALAGIAGLLALFLLVSAVLPRLRVDALRALPVPLLLVAGTIAGAQASKPIRAEGWERLAARGDVTVAAIQAFEARNGSPPASLGDLAAGRSAALPGTGLGSRPEFRYEVSHGKPGAASFRLWTKLPGISHATDFEHLPAAEVEAWHTVAHRIGDWVVVVND
jgi:hypothetical protein